MIGVIAITAVVLWLFLTKSNDTFVPEVITYNNHVFTSLEDGKWLLTLQDIKNRREYDIPLYYNPTELEDEVLVSGDMTELYNVLNNNGLNAVYVTFDPDATNFSALALASAELSLNFAQVLDITPIGACTKNETDACIGRPIVNCSAEDRVVIYLRESSESFTHIREDFNCYIIEGKDKNLLKAVDRFLYELYGIMED